MESPTRAQLQQQIDDLTEANAALLDGYGTIKVAYLAIRMRNLEDNRRKFEGDVDRQLSALTERLNALADTVAKLKVETHGDRAQINQRIDAAGREVKKLMSLANRNGSEGGNG